jgi:hypothetical protein
MLVSHSEVDPGGRIWTITTCTPMHWMAEDNHSKVLQNKVSTNSLLFCALFHKLLAVVQISLGKTSLLQHSQ